MENPYDFELFKYEKIEENESALMAKLILLLKQLIKKTYLTGTTYRDTHAKGHAIVKAKFVVESDIDDELKVGLFKTPKSYDAWIRWSNLNPTPQEDYKKDIRAMAIKLMGVDGERLWQDQPEAKTLDLIMMGSQTFLAPSLKDFYNLEKAIYKGGLALPWFFLTHFAIASTIIKGQKRCANVLEIPYWSQTAYLFGEDRAVQYHIRPHVSDTYNELPDDPSSNYLRERLESQLAKEEVKFDFMVQFQVDPKKMPIENPNKAWSPKLSPFRKVATIVLPTQLVSSPEQMEFAENVSFNPWRTLPEHRPLGAVNRARLKIYPAISEFRHTQNVAPIKEPTPDLTFPEPDHKPNGNDSSTSTTMKKKILNILKYAAVLALTVVAARFVYLFYFPNLPKSVQVYDVRHLNDQVWTDSVKQQYYHTDQGSRLMPYKWYVNLEKGTSRKMFNNPNNLSRFRLLPDPNPTNNKYRLPIGFAITAPDVIDNVQYVGISCATCHTGQLNYKGMGLRIDGGSGMVDFNQFLAEMIQSLALTISPFRPAKFDRFARRIYGDKVTQEQKEKLEKKIEDYIKVQAGGLLSQHVQDILQGGEATDQGFGRIDALGAGGNALYRNFGNKNLRPLDAPVGIPVLWYTHQYDWVQLNGSIRQPMSRNIIEALAVNARVTVPGKNAPYWNNLKDLYLSNIDMKKMYELEDAISKLKAPEWPEEILGVLDKDKVKKGKLLYTKNCATCHAKKLEPNYGYWPKLKGDTVSYKYKKQYYVLRLFDVGLIGTDSTDAVNFADRNVALSKEDASILSLPKPDGKDGDYTGATIISTVIDGVMKRSYDTLRNKWKREDGLSAKGADSLIAKWNGDRQSMWRAPKAYPARPLTGIWTSSPYLHNNSIPNLFELLSPVEERHSVFYTGDLEFDPEKVGYNHEPFSGATKIDTKEKGNSNKGHEFTNRSGAGVIGSLLSVEDRYAIIEYLKQLTFDQEGYELYFPNSAYADSLRNNEFYTMDAASGYEGSYGKASLD